MLEIGMNTDLDYSNPDELSFGELMELAFFTSVNLLKVYAKAVYRQLSDKHGWKIRTYIDGDGAPICACFKVFGKYHVECDGAFYDEDIDGEIVGIRDAWTTFFHAEYKVLVDGGDVALDPISECRSVIQKYFVNCTPRIGRECIAELAKVINDKAEEIIKGLAGIR